MNVERSYQLKVYTYSGGMSLQFTNERQQTIASCYIESGDPSVVHSRLLSVFKEEVTAEIEQLFIGLITQKFK